MATGVRIDGGRIVLLGWEGFMRTRSAWPCRTAATRTWLRFGRVRPRAFDFEGGRLASAARDRVERLGSVQALAKIVTRNRAGDRHARSRAVTLAAR